MTKTIVVSDEVWQQLFQMRIDGKHKSMNETLMELFKKIKK